MQGSVTTAAIDNDFLAHALEIRKPPDEVVRILSAVFRDLKVFPIMHPLVYDKEAQKGKPLIRQIFAQVIRVLSFEDIHENDPNKMQYYEFLVCELYNKLFGLPLNLKNCDVYTYWRRQSSLGEIHSLAMCLLCNCGIFLSDDEDSKRLQRIVEQCFASHITVYDRQEVREAISAREHSVSRLDLRLFSHKSCN